MKEYMNQVSVEDALRAGHTDTICWDCAKACRGGCSWADPELQKPVENWTATKNTNGYIVHDCPEFIRETYGCGRYRTADDYILALEIAVTERKKQLARLKRTPGLLRKKNALLANKNEKLQNILDKELWQIQVHMSE